MAKLPSAATATDQPNATHNADATASEELRFWKIAPILATIFADLLGLTILLPLLALYATSFGARPWEIGLMQALYPLSQFLAAPILGALSDRYGRKPVLLASQLVSLAGLLVIGFAGNLGMLLVGRFIAGAGAGNIATAQAALSDLTTSRTRTQGLALLGAAFGLGFIIGPALASLGLTLSGGNYQVPAFTAAACMACAALLTATVFKETLSPAHRTAGAVALSTITNLLPSMARALRRPVVGVLLVVMLAQQMLFSLVETFFSTLTLTRVGLGGAGTALVFVLVGVLSLIIQVGLAGPLSRRFGERNLVLAGIVGLGIGMALLGLTPTQVLPGYEQAVVAQEMASSAGEPISSHQSQAITAPSNDAARGYGGLGWLLGAILPFVAGAALLQPNINSLITQHVEPREFGSVLGLSASYLSLGNVLGPLVGGMIYQIVGLTVLYVGGGVLLLGVFVFALSYVRPDQPTR